MDGTVNGNLYNLDIDTNVKLDNGGNAVWRENSLYNESETLLAIKEKTLATTGKITLHIVDTNAIYEITAENADFDPEKWNNDVGDSNAKITIKVGDTVIRDNAKMDILRSYTGVWYGLVCTVDHGVVS